MSARRIIGSAILTLAALGAVACGGDGGDVTDPGSPEMGTLLISNTSSIRALLIRDRACGTAQWGDDLLSDANSGVGGTLDPAETGTWQVAPGCYDLEFTPVEDVAVFVVSSVQIQPAQSTTVALSSWPVE